MVRKIVFVRAYSWHGQGVLAYHRRGGLQGQGLHPLRLPQEDNEGGRPAAIQSLLRRAFQEAFLPLSQNGGGEKFLFGVSYEAGARARKSIHGWNESVLRLQRFPGLIVLRPSDGRSGKHSIPSRGRWGGNCDAPWTPTYGQFILFVVVYVVPSPQGSSLQRNVAHVGRSRFISFRSGPRVINVHQPDVSSLA